MNCTITKLKLNYSKTSIIIIVSLAWQIPWMEEPGRLQSMGLLGVGHH